MLELEDARERLLTSIHALPSESVATWDAEGRIVAEAISAPIPLPVFDNSAMDGYAVRAEDVRNASPDHPVQLRQVALVAAGTQSRQPVGQGECIRIFTGSPLPEGANSVVMQEDTRCLDSADHATIEILDAVKPWENVRLQGEDIKTGTELFHRGDRLGVASLALLSALGIGSVKVHKSPKVGVLASGSELIESASGITLTPGKIFESNRILIAHLIRKSGGVYCHYPIVRDTLSATKQALSDALESGDVLVTSGGVSVGEFDFLKEAWTALGGNVDFWKVSVRPGKPFVFGQWRGKVWFGLPGNPVSALVTFLLLVRPALLKMQGASLLDMFSTTGHLQQSLENRGDRRHFVRVRVTSTGQVQAAGTQMSHMLSSMAASNGLVDIPPHSLIPAGSPVRVLLWDL